MSFSASSQVLPAELTEDCEEGAGWEKQLESHESESEEGLLRVVSSECWEETSDQMEADEAEAAAASVEL
jgi:hypothetical protein